MITQSVRWGKTALSSVPGVHQVAAAVLAPPESRGKTCFPRKLPVSWERPGSALETPPPAQGDPSYLFSSASRGIG